MGFLDWFKRGRTEMYNELKPLPRKLLPRPAVTHDHFEQLWVIDRVLNKTENTVMRVKIGMDTAEDVRENANTNDRVYGTYVPMEHE